MTATATEVQAFIDATLAVAAEWQTYKDGQPGETMQIGSNPLSPPPPPPVS